MSKSESRRADQVITLRCTTEQRQLLERAIERSMVGTPGFFTASLSGFVLNAALNYAQSILGEPGDSPITLKELLVTPIDSVI